MSESGRNGHVSQSGQRAESALRRVVNSWREATCTSVFCDWQTRKQTVSIRPKWLRRRKLASHSVTRKFQSQSDWSTFWWSIWLCSMEFAR